MTKKHFIAIAYILRKHYTDIGDPSNHKARADMVDAIAIELAEYFGQANPNFNRARFLRACKESD